MESFQIFLKERGMCHCIKVVTEMITVIFRLVSLLPIFSRIFEKLIYVRTEQYFEEKIIFTVIRLQKELFNWAHIAILTTLVNGALYSKMKIATVFLNNLKAFFSFHQRIILKKLENCGVTGSIMNFISSYLSNRHLFKK